jgi:hypothetical protein
MLHPVQVLTELTSPANMVYLSATQPVKSKGPTAVLLLPAFTAGQVSSERSAWRRAGYAELLPGIWLSKIIISQVF